MTGESFPALSIWQPWAELIVSGRKSIEVRTWVSPYRGRIWVHAGLRCDPSLDERFGLKDLFRGGFVGSVELTSIEYMDAARWESWRIRHVDPGPYLPSRSLYAWVLSNPRRLLQPVLAPGAPGLFVPTPAIRSQLNAAEFFAEPSQSVDL